MVTVKILKVHNSTVKLNALEIIHLIPWYLYSKKKKKKSGEIEHQEFSTVRVIEQQQNC